MRGRKPAIPPAPSAGKPEMMEAPSATAAGAAVAEENDALTLNISAMGGQQPKVPGPAKGTDNFNANSEMADIDRRLNALQVS